MAKIWDHYTYRIGSYFLPVLINGDASGLAEAEALTLTEFEAYAQRCAIKDGFTVGHWDYESEEGEDYGKCEVTDLYGTLAEVRLIVYKEKHNA